MIESAPLQEESVLFHPQRKQFCLLNKTMAFIWTRLGESASADEILADLCRNFRGVESEQARADVDSALEQLLSLELLVAEN